MLNCHAPEWEIVGFIRNLVRNMGISKSIILPSFVDRISRRRGFRKDALDKIFALHIAKAVSAAQRYHRVALRSKDPKMTRLDQRVKHSSYMSTGIALSIVYDFLFDDVLSDWQPMWLCRYHRQIDKRFPENPDLILPDERMLASMMDSSLHKKGCPEEHTICGRCKCKCLRGVSESWWWALNEEYVCALPKTQAWLRLFWPKPDYNDYRNWRIEIYAGKSKQTAY